MSYIIYYIGHLCFLAQCLLLIMSLTTLKKSHKKIAERDNTKLSLRGNLYKKNKRRVSFSKLLKIGFISTTFVVIIFTSIYVLFLTNYTSAESISQKTVLNKLSQTLVLPDQAPSDLRRVSNADQLAKEDPFYKNVQNGDYIIFFKNMIVIFDFNKGLIKNVKTAQS